MKGTAIVVVVLMLTVQVSMRLSTVEEDRPPVVADITMNSMTAVDFRFDL